MEGYIPPPHAMPRTAKAILVSWCSDMYVDRDDPDFKTHGFFEHNTIGLERSPRFCDGGFGEAVIGMSKRTGDECHQQEASDA
jgi:hypothetical protein